MLGENVVSKISTCLLIFWLYKYFYPLILALLLAIFFSINIILF